VCELGGTVQPKGKADGADAAIDVELHVAEVEEAFNIFLAHGRKDEGADVGQADLAAVGVAGEHDIDEREARVKDDVVDVIGLVAHEENRGAGVFWDGEVEVGIAGSSVVGATQPEDVAATLEGRVAVDEDGCAVGFERLNDVFCADVDVVVAEDAEALRSFEGGENLGSDAGGLPGYGQVAGATADVVAGDKDEIRVEVVDLFDHALEEEGFGVLLQVDVAHLDDAEVLEGVGEVADGEGDLGDFEFVAGVGAGVGGDAKPGGSGGGEETPAGNGGRFRVAETAAATGHSPS